MRTNINHLLKRASRVDYCDYGIGRTVEARTLADILSEIGGFGSGYRARLKNISSYGTITQYDYRFALLDFSILIYD